MLKQGLLAGECLALDTNHEIKLVKVNTSHNHQILVGSYYRHSKSTLDALDELDFSLNKADT